MPQTQREFPELQLAVGEPQIGATDSARVNAHEHLTGTNRRSRPVLQFPRTIGRRYDDRFHPTIHRTPPGWTIPIESGSW
jgi:hypothetical protein